MSHAELALASMQLCLALCLGCAPSAARFATVDPNALALPREAPGVAVDPVSHWPAPATQGRAGASLLVLESPASLSAARATIDRFFRALVSESPDTLDAVMSEQAYIDSGSGRQPARGALRSRFLQLDYTALRGLPLYRESDVEVYRYDDAQALKAERALPDDIGREQVFVRVRLSVSRAGKTRLLADEMGFLLRLDRDGYRIVSIREDAPVP